MTADPAALASSVEATFADLHRRVFLGDPAANPRLLVEVREPCLVGDTPTMVLITPWTLNGLAFPPDGVLADTLAVGDRNLPVFANDLPALGHYQSVNLVSDVSGLETMAAARSLADALAGPFREGVAEARPTKIDDPGRRRLLIGWADGRTAS